MAIGLPPMVAPVTWSCGFCPSALPPASLMRAYFAPESDSASNVANGPPQVVSTPILMAPAGRGGRGRGSDAPDDDEFPTPHPTSARTAALTTAATCIGRPTGSWSSSLTLLFPGVERPVPPRGESTDNRLTIVRMIGITFLGVKGRDMSVTSTLRADRATGRDAPAVPARHPH